MAGLGGRALRGRYRWMVDRFAQVFGPHAGLLFLVPLAVLVGGSRWTWERVVVPDDVTQVGPRGRPHGSAARRLWLYEDGTTWERGIVLDRNGALELRLDRPVRAFTLTLQGNLAESYRVQASRDGRRYETVWQVGGTGTGDVLETTESSLIVLPGPVDRLRVVPDRGRDRFAISWLSVRRPPLVFPHWLLPPVIWGAWLLLMLARRLPRARAHAERVLAGWARVDPPAGALLAFAVLFQVPLGSMLWVLPLGVLLGLAMWVRHAPVPALATLAIVVGLGGLVVPRLLTRVVVAGIARFHELNVDHRMRPYVMEDINGDGIRFRGESSDVEDRQFVVLFLGDSFTYGFHLEYGQTYPAQFQALAARAGCQDVVAVNMGWTSSSPLLSLRLLKEIGYRYHPDLVVYSLDMTDFSDDLRYEEALARGGDLHPDPSAVARKLLAIYFPAIAANLGELSRADLALRWRRATASRTGPSVQRGPSYAGEKFFVTNHPLAETRADIERGVMRNLEALHGFSTRVLGVPMVLVLYPRAYQYSTRESPNNNEKGLYVPLGPYVLEPFRYFDEVKDRLPYPVISILDAFQSSEEFPLYFSDDPHWNARGAWVAARAVFERLRGRGMLPCPEP